LNFLLIEDIILESFILHDESHHSIELEEHLEKAELDSKKNNVCNFYANNFKIIINKV